MRKEQTLVLEAVEVKTQYFFCEDEEVRGKGVTLSETTKGAEETFGHSVEEH